ncbi:MAG: DUF1127 domain-containing protein [Pseudomonadota bacterium]
MSDFIFKDAVRHQGPLAVISRLFRGAVARITSRRDTATLNKLPDHLLKDVGLDRSRLPQSPNWQEDREIQSFRSLQERARF